MEVTAQLKIVVDQEEQDQLWNEVGQMAKEIGWGLDYWEFENQAKGEFILIKKPPK